MGKGDKKTRKGKIAKGTFGVSRPKSASRAVKLTNPAEEGKAKPKKKKK